MRTWRLVLTRGNEVTVRRTSANDLQTAWDIFFGMPDLRKLLETANRVSVELEAL